jgi:hypothetical protein
MAKKISPVGMTAANVRDDPFETATNRVNRATMI